MILYEYTIKTQQSRISIKRLLLNNYTDAKVEIDWNVYCLK